MCPSEYRLTVNKILSILPSKYALRFSRYYEGQIHNKYFAFRSSSSHVLCIEVNKPGKQNIGDLVNG